MNIKIYDLTQISIMITVPIYLYLPYKYKRTQKKNSDWLYVTPINFNEWRLMNRFSYPKIKKAFATIAKEQVQWKVYQTPIKVEFNLFYKNIQSDLPNWESMVNKFFLDVLQKEGCIPDDNVVHVTETVARVIEQDRDNPRMEVVITENYII